ncbi:HAD family hydrolase [Bordetella sp. H567]|uniref:haloacid dehalogenase type II n=1 Tax=Bordetella sp. H567 TaxID=1697043 RepID=UPI00081CB490|nr:haloacid dehalogenase type II [Bordetella sp. H567]AOB32387.1 HAD family hydrolase [Bordetella sp. H567]
MPRTEAVVFDLYGTLYDVHSVARECDACHPGRGMEFSMLWRQKQLEYTWLRSLMGQYIPFEQATRDALVYTCRALKVDPDPATLASLCDAYLKLAPYPDVPDVLRRLNALGLPLAILSNGSVFSIASVVDASGLRSHFSHLLSVEAVRVYKPDFRVYRLACEQLGVPADRILFVSSNAWDAAGAYHFGFDACWVNRDGRTFDELGAAPRVIGGLDELPVLSAKNKP